MMKLNVLVNVKKVITSIFSYCLMTEIFLNQESPHEWNAWVSKLAMKCWETV